MMSMMSGIRPGSSAGHAVPGSQWKSTGMGPTSPVSTSAAKETLTLRAVYSIDGEFVPLVYIESINETYTHKEDEVVEKLRNNKLVRIRTLSGKEHVISMNGMIEMLKKKDITGVIPTDVKEMWSVVFESWMSTLKGK